MGRSLTQLNFDHLMNLMLVAPKTYQLSRHNTKLETSPTESTTTYLINRGLRKAGTTSSVVDDKHVSRIHVEIDFALVVDYLRALYQHRGPSQSL